jgi:lipoprotein-anchoring transpeptidase ErfK/SrfK
MKILQWDGDRRIFTLNLDLEYEAMNCVQPSKMKRSPTFNYFWLSSLITLLGLFAPARSLLADDARTIPYYGYQGSPSTAALTEPATQPLRLEIDLSRRRLIVYQGGQKVKTYPVAVGREGWHTPLGNFEVRQMIHNPSWKNPMTGEVIAGGSSGNPLGHYWIGFWTDGHNWVGMHGTPDPDSVGRAASHGCIRLYNQDIQELFALVNLGTPVDVVP